MDRALVDRSQLRIDPLTPHDSSRFETFSCGVPDLDDFLREDAWKYHDAHISFTYLATLDGVTVGFISLANDTISLDAEEQEGLPPVMFPVPALKVTRLAVNLEAKQRLGGIGTALMAIAWIRGASLADSAACRFLTLDAYSGAITFYEGLGFVKNLAKQYKKKRHLSMRLDLFAPEIPSWVLDSATPPSPSP